MPRVDYVRRAAKLRCPICEAAPSLSAGGGARVLPKGHPQCPVCKILMGPGHVEAWVGGPCLTCAGRP